MNTKAKEEFLNYLKGIGIAEGAIRMIKNHMNCTHAFKEVSTPTRQVSDSEIEKESEKCNHPMTSVSEGIYVPIGFIYGAKWMRNKQATITISLPTDKEILDESGRYQYESIKNVDGVNPDSLREECVAYYWGFKACMKSIPTTREVKSECKHNFGFYYANTTYDRDLWRCRKCGKIEYKDPSLLTPKQGQ